ncbi:MAG: oligosaccharide flippase family protein [Planctomycetales bacterium]|nr:oligosaccharide flippase family protein [Planctomycetales bacterium]
MCSAKNESNVAASHWSARSIPGLGQLGDVIRIGRVVMMRGLGVVLSFLLTIVLSRTLGATGVGLFFFFNSALRLLAALVAFGLPQYNLRTVAALDAHGDHHQADIIAARSLWFVFFGGGLVMALTWMAAGPIAAIVLGDATLVPQLRAACLCAVAFAMLRVRCEALKSRGLPQTALLLEFALSPAALIVICVATWFVKLDLSLSAVLNCFIGATVVAVGLASLTWRQRSQELRLPLGHPEAHQPLERIPVRTLAVFLVWNLLNALAWAGPYMVLPRFASSGEIGLFGTAHRLIALPSIILVALGSYFAPRFSRCHAQGDIRTNRLQLRRSQLYAALAFLPLFAMFLFAPAELLSVFGPEFREAAPILRVLTIGATINALTGLAADFLNMTHHENYEATITGVSAVSLVVLTVVLGIPYGLMGAAIATTVAMAGRNVASFLLCQLVIRQEMRRAV